MSSRQPNMTKMARGNTQQRVARQMQQYQNQNNFIGGFASLPENDNNNTDTNSDSPMVVGSHHFNPQLANNFSATPDMTMGNSSFDCFTQSWTRNMCNQDQFFGDKQNSFTVDAQMPVMDEFNMQPSFWQTHSVGNAQTPLMDNTQASAMNNSQGFTQQLSGLRANAPSFTPTQNIPVPQKNAAFMANMHPTMIPHMQMEMYMQQMKEDIQKQAKEDMKKESGKKDEIINNLMKQLPGSSTWSNPQHGPASQKKRGSEKQQRKSPITQFSIPRASIPGTPAAQSRPTQSSVAQTAIAQTPIEKSPALPSPMTVASSNKSQATQSPSAEFSGSQDGNTVNDAQALDISNQVSASSAMIALGPKRNSSLGKASQMLNSVMAINAPNPNARLLPQDVRPHRAITPPPRLEVFLNDRTLKINIPKRTLGEEPPNPEPSTPAPSAPEDSSVEAEEPSTPADFTRVATFQDPNSPSVYPHGLFAPSRDDGSKKLTPKEKKVREAEDKGEKIFPSQRRMVRIDPSDPRLIHDKNGAAIPPEGDDYNLYYLPGPKDISGKEIDKLVNEFRAKQAAMDEAVANGESIEKFKKKKKKPKTPKKPSTPRKPRVAKPPSEDIVNKKRHQSTATSTASVAGDAQLPTTHSAQLNANKGFITPASDDPFTTQTNTAFPAQVAGGGFTQNLAHNLFAPGGPLDNGSNAQTRIPGFTYHTTAGELLDLLNQDSGLTSQATNNGLSAQSIADDVPPSQSFNASRNQLASSEDIILKSTEDFSMVNNDDFEIPADLDPMLVDASNTAYEDLPLITESSAQSISPEAPSTQSPLTPCSASTPFQSSDANLDELAKWLDLEMRRNGQSGDASAIESQEKLPQTKAGTSKSPIIDPSLSLPVQDSTVAISDTDSLFGEEKNTWSEPYTEIESMFPQDDEQGTQLRKVSNRLDRPLPEQTDITALVADIPNPYNRDLDTERVALIERFRAGVVLSHTDRNLLLVFAQCDPSIDVDAVNRQTENLPEGVAPADMPGWGDDVPDNIFDSLAPIPEDNLRDPNASTGNDITMFPVAGSDITGPATATSNQPNTTWPAAAPSVSLADMPYSPILAPRETIAPAFQPQPSQDPIFHPRDPFNAGQEVITNNHLEGLFLNPDVLRQTPTAIASPITTAPTTAKITTATTKSSSNKRKASEDTSAAPKKARTKKVPVPQLAMPKCDVRFSPRAEHGEDGRRMS
ncbi:hypothetical protein FBEOM_10598 [Fusarium beomiforme]|uniref:Uncharacterized protein n=1 Tax=Fusarium beomiforme TaxID=44412 RepID=A0A9P5DS97_9HYPO|nr:hypothetical protein FBEOM_10598 [Fusarium beomiforme]